MASCSTCPGWPTTIRRWCRRRAWTLWSHPGANVWSKKCHIKRYQERFWDHPQRLSCWQVQLFCPGTKLQETYRVTWYHQIRLNSDAIGGRPNHKDYVSSIYCTHTHIYIYIIVYNTYCICICACSIVPGSVYSSYLSPTHEFGMRSTSDLCSCQLRIWPCKIQSNYSQKPQTPPFSAPHFWSPPISAVWSGLTWLPWSSCCTTFVSHLLPLHGTSPCQDGCCTLTPSTWCWLSLNRSMRLHGSIPSHHLALCGSHGLKFRRLPGRHLPVNLLASSLFPFEVLYRDRCLFWTVDMVVTSRTGFYRAGVEIPLGLIQHN